MKKRSLRSRLLVATVVLVALGLLAADTATFALLRASLVNRVDQQLEGAREVARRALTGDRGFPFGGGGGPGDRGGLPASVAELVDASGHVAAARSFGFGTVVSAPNLPAGLPGSTAYRGAERVTYFNARAFEGSQRYRVRAEALGNGTGTFVVALSLDDVESTLGRLLLVEGSVTIFVLGLVAGVALWLVKLGLRPLTQIEETAAEIAAGDLSRRVEPADDGTEVGRLGGALNVMLSKIEAAFAERAASEARLRRFIADASHELRTPLTSIRGYAELFRHGAADKPEDLQKSMRRIEEESSRMGAMVDELLLLARLDQGRPLDAAPLDLAVIAADAVHDAKARQPDRPIDLETTGPLEIEGDEQRLRQVAANLLANALEHTPADTPVHVRVRADGDEAIVEVADEGPGLDAEHAAKVFDRFFRVDPARSHNNRRDNGGAGLGLSIVAAIVHAHGGRVGVETAPGAGARFIVVLPRRAPQAAAPSEQADAHGAPSELTASSEEQAVQ